MAWPDPNWPSEMPPLVDDDRPAPMAGWGTGGGFGGAGFGGPSTNAWGPQGNAGPSQSAGAWGSFANQVPRTSWPSPPVQGPTGWGQSHLAAPDPWGANSPASSGFSPGGGWGTNATPGFNFGGGASEQPVTGNSWFARGAVAGSAGATPGFGLGQALPQVQNNVAFPGLQGQGQGSGMGMGMASPHPGMGMRDPVDAWGLDPHDFGGNTGFRSAGVGMGMGGGGFGPTVPDGMAMGGSPLRRSHTISGGRLTSYHFKNGMKRAQSNPMEYGLHNLAKRPRDWRSDYSVRGGLMGLVSGATLRMRSDVVERSDPVKRTICPLLAFVNDPNAPAILHDLRNHPFSPNAINFPALNRPHNEIDLYQIATVPPASFLRLYHSKLPWYIDIEQSQPNGITVADILLGMYRQLYIQISGRHYWNSELDEADRAALAGAFQVRTGAIGDGPGGVNEHMMKQGVMRIDFLGMEKRLMFVGLARGKNGMLEMKLKRVEL